MCSEFSQVYIQVTLDRDRCVWIFCPNLIYSFLEIFYEVRGFSWPPVCVYYCVCWVVFLFVLVYMEDYGACFWDINLFFNSRVEVVFCVYRDALFVFGCVSWDTVAAGVVLEIIVGECDDICWLILDFEVFFEEIEVFVEGADVCVVEREGVFGSGVRVQLCF